MADSHSSEYFCRASERCELVGTRSSSFFTSSNGSKTTPLKASVVELLDARTEKDRRLPDFPEETRRFEDKGEISFFTPWKFTSERAEEEDEETVLSIFESLTVQIETVRKFSSRENWSRWRVSGRRRIITKTEIAME